MIKLAIFISFYAALLHAEPMVNGNHFSILATQELEFTDLKPTDLSPLGADTPKVLDLKEFQSPVKNQGVRESCTYVVMSGLIESLLKKKTKEEIDISEEYIAWASKTKLKLRQQEEDSSVAVNALTIQKFGYMLEKDMPFEPSWFEKGYPCEKIKKDKKAPLHCYAHKKKPGKIHTDQNFIFEAVDSTPVDVIRAMNKYKNPVTVSIKANMKAFDRSWKTGEIILKPEEKQECIKKTARCSSHAALIVGYDLNKKIFTFKNSWGPEWGDKGYGTISFDYMDQMSARKFMTGYIETQKDFKK